MHGRVDCNSCIDKNIRHTIGGLHLLYCRVLYGSGQIVCTRVHMWLCVCACVSVLVYKCVCKCVTMEYVCMTYIATSGLHYLFYVPLILFNAFLAYAMYNIHIVRSIVMQYYPLYVHYTKYIVLKYLYYIII